MKPSLLPALLFTLAAAACQNVGETAPARAEQLQDSLIRSHMTTYVDSVWNQKDTTFLNSITKGTLLRSLNGITVADTPREMQSHLQVYFTAFPDIRIAMEQAYVWEDMAFVQWSADGTNTGIFGEIAATGKKVRMHGISQFFFDKDGNLEKEYVFFNELDLLQQLGYTLLPPVLE